MESPEETAEPVPKKLKISNSPKEEKESEVVKTDFAALKNGVVVEVLSDVRNKVHIIMYKIYLSMIST
jgi:hypothetical protein